MLAKFPHYPLQETPLLNNWLDKLNAVRHWINPTTTVFPISTSQNQVILSQITINYIGFNWKLSIFESQLKLFLIVSDQCSRVCYCGHAQRRTISAPFIHARLQLIRKFSGNNCATRSGIRQNFGLKAISFTTNLKKSIRYRNTKWIKLPWTKIWIVTDNEIMGNLPSKNWTWNVTIRRFKTSRRLKLSITPGRTGFPNFGEYSDGPCNMLVRAFLNLLLDLRKIFLSERTKVWLWAKSGQQGRKNAPLCKR